MKLTEEGKKYLKLSKDVYITYKSNKAINQEEYIEIYLDFTDTYFNVEIKGDSDDVIIEQSYLGSIILPGKKTMREQARGKEALAKEKEIIRIVTSETMNHVWNEVKLDGE